MRLMKRETRDLMAGRDHSVQGRGSAEGVAAESKTSAPWTAIEQAAFRDHKEVLLVQSAFRSSKSLPARLLRFLEYVVGGAIFVFAPMFSYILLIPSRYQIRSPDYSTLIPVSATLSLLTFLGLLGILIGWVARGRLKSGAIIGYALYCLVFSALAAFTITARGPDAELSGAELWRLPALACIAVCVLSIVVYPLLVVRVKGVASVAELPARVQKTVIGRRERFELLSAEEKAAITADLEAAIDVLVDRRLIDAATAARARSAEPGALEIWMKY